MLQIPNYRIEGLIGEGGMGMVYKGVHLNLDRPVAIKVLHPLLVKEPQLRERFYNEARLMAKLVHPNIVQLFDFNEQDDVLYLVMEYVDGRTLDKVIGREVGPIPHTRAIPLIRQILEGVNYAHEQGIIHRDIKPSNILLTPKDIIKITDFGIAKIAGSKGMTKTGTKVGTLFYMSPEQVMGKEADQRSDLYSIGVTAYEMLSGKMPLDDGTSSEYQVMDAIVHRSFPDPRSYYPDIPEWLVNWVMQMIAKQPQDRFHSCKSALVALQSNEQQSTPTSVYVGNNSAPLPVSKNTQQSVSLNPSTSTTRPKVQLKSPWIAALLSLICGGFGLFYVSAVQGFLGIAVGIFWGLITKGKGAFYLLWIAYPIWGFMAADNFNSKRIQQLK
ncbi:MAG: serine/threonine protein kinase [bacterium]|nr:serine/threonine protein kinase [bacterium]